jgi:hypothetical protein
VRYPKGTTDNPELTTTDQIVDMASAGAEFLQVAAIYRGRPEKSRQILILQSYFVCLVCFVVHIPLVACDGLAIDLQLGGNSALGPALAMKGQDNVYRGHFEAIRHGAAPGKTGSLRAYLANLLSS